MDAWIQDELEACTFDAPRLSERLGSLLENMSKHVGQPIPLACQDWAGTKAAYRFLDNPRVDEAATRAWSKGSRFARTPDGTLFSNQELTHAKH
jgi:hypothetical protein